VIEVVVEGVDPSALHGEGLTHAREELASEMAPLDPKLQDVITLLLSSKSVADVSTPEGKAALKAELLEALGAVVGEDRLLDVYFTQFVIQ
jgi:flagellar FliL protein